MKYLLSFLTTLAISASVAFAIANWHYDRITAVRLTSIEALVQTDQAVAGRIADLRSQIEQIKIGASSSSDAEATVKRLADALSQMQRDVHTVAAKQTESTWFKNYFWSVRDSPPYWRGSSVSWHLRLSAGAAHRCTKGLTMRCRQAMTGCKRFKPHG